jgi:hypothetical protein
VLRGQASRNEQESENANQTSHGAPSLIVRSLALRAGNFHGIERPGVQAAYTGRLPPEAR